MSLEQLLPHRDMEDLEEEEAVSISRNAAWSKLIVSGILGVLLKHALQAAFASQLQNPFHQFPANMVGCFMVGFFVNTSAAAATVVGSLTSFAVWNQSIILEFFNGHCLFALCSLLTGLELAYMSFKVGLDTAEMIYPPELRSAKIKSSRLSNLFSVLLWLLVVALAILDTVRRQLWLACVVAPLGVWIRSSLAKLNRRSLPQGTLIANLLACFLQAGLVVVKVSDSATEFAMEAFQKGFVDSIGTISTVVAEADALHRKKDKAWRAYSYVISTMVTCLSVVFAIVSASSSLSVDIMEVVVARQTNANL